VKSLEGEGVLGSLNISQNKSFGKDLYLLQKNSAQIHYFSAKEKIRHKSS